MPERRIEWSGFEADSVAEANLLDAFRSGWISGGPYVEDFEALCEQKFRGSKAVAVSNGTVALQLAFQLLGVSPGDKVLVPAFCFQAAANVLIQQQAIPVYVDADWFTWNISPEALYRAYTEDVVGVVVVHNYGCSSQISEIASWAERKKIWLVEDCAESWFSSSSGQYLGTFGQIATFSLHATKTISAGEGGLVLLNDPQLVEQAKMMRSHGFQNQGPKYFHAFPGNNYRMSNLHCAIACAQMSRVDEILFAQRAIMSQYDQLLDGCDLVKRQRSLIDSRDEKWAMALDLDLPRLLITRDQVIEQLDSRGVECRPGFFTPEKFPYVQSGAGANWRTAINVSQRTIVLPCSKSLDPSEIRRACRALIEVVNENRRFGSELKFVDLSSESEAETLLKDFVASMGASSRSFRYFNHRNFSIVRKHIESILLVLDNRPVAYGHLEADGDIVWLGVAVIESALGKGFGDIVVADLLERGAKKQLQTIFLRVDRDNSRARKLYRRYGFVDTDYGEKDCEMCLQIPTLN